MVVESSSGHPGPSDPHHRQYRPPASLGDAISDGAIAQADLDATLTATYGPVTGVEFSGPQPDSSTMDAEVEVRVYPATGKPLSCTGTRVARIHNGLWYWLTSLTARFPIPEFHTVLPASDGLIAAARTLSGNGPVLLAPHSDGSTAVVALPPPAMPQVSDPRTALTTGIERMDPAVDARRAVLGFATFRGIGVKETQAAITVQDGTTVTFDAADNNRAVDISPGMSLTQLYDDAAYLSTEHQFLYSARWATPPPQVDLPQQRGLVGGRPVAVDTLGVLDGDVFHWAWAWPGFQFTPMTSASSAAGRLRSFGLDNGIPGFFRATLPTSGQSPDTEIEVERVTVAAKAVLGRWVHLHVPIGPGLTAVVLVDGPHLHLPAASQRAVGATVRAARQRVTDRHRAASAYARWRGVGFNGFELIMDDGTVDAT